MKYRIVYYMNQFFGGLGGEEKADIPPSIHEKKIGPSLALDSAFGDQIDIVATCVCGDNYAANNIEEVGQYLIEVVKKYKADALVAGPAFNAGRYGTACGTVCKAVGDALGIPTITAMYEENPGVDLYRKDILIVSTSNSARGMKDAIPAMGNVLLKCLKKEVLGRPEEEGLLPRGIRINQFYETCGAERAVDMLVKKLKNEPFKTEYPMPIFDRVEPRPPVVDMSKATIALVTSGGIVPFDNPDHIPASSAQNYGEYDISGVSELKAGKYKTAHGGYDQTYANEVPDRVLPLDVVVDLVNEKRIGALYPKFYSTVGNGTSVVTSKQFGIEIGKKLRDANVQAVILTSTWGTCTRCGATLAKAIEDTANIPVVHMATIVPISVSVGANRIVPTVSIPYPLGNPALSLDEEKALRRDLVEQALVALETPVTEQTVFKV